MWILSAEKYFVYIYYLKTTFGKLDYGRGNPSWLVKSKQKKKIHIYVMYRQKNAI